MTSAVSINTALTQQSRTDAAENQLADDFSQFLNLLTVQLQNQDPLSPMDTTEFTNQIVAFTGVEQQINTNQKLDSLVSLSLGNAMGGALEYVGLDVSYLSSEMSFEGDPININYALNEEAVTSIMRIYNDVGDLVLEQEVSGNVGSQEFTWDGLDNFGNTVPNGTYNVEIDALNAEGNALEANTVVSGRVRGVESQGGLVFLLVGERAVSLGTILNVQQPSEAETTPDPEPDEEVI